MDPISIVAGVSTIVANAYTLSKQVYDIIDAITNAPFHIAAISRDIQGLYLVLASLQGLLQSLQHGSLSPSILSILDSLQQPLNHCFFAFHELQSRINKYTRPTKGGTGSTPKLSKWTAFRWQFTEKEANTWRGHLTSYKLTVDVAIATANLANTSSNLSMSRSIENQIQDMRIQMEMTRNNEEIDPSMLADNGSQITDRFFALNRFLETTETVLSGSPRSSRSPSPDVLPTVYEAPVTVQQREMKEIKPDPATRVSHLRSISSNAFDGAYRRRKRELGRFPGIDGTVVNTDFAPRSHSSVQEPPIEVGYATSTDDRPIGPGPKRQMEARARRLSSRPIFSPNNLWERENTSQVPNIMVEGADLAPPVHMEITNLPEQKVRSEPRVSRYGPPLNLPLSGDTFRAPTVVSDYPYPPPPAHMANTNFTEIEMIEVPGKYKGEDDKVRTPAAAWQPIAPEIYRPPWRSGSQIETTYMPPKTETPPKSEPLDEEPPASQGIGQAISTFDDIPEPEHITAPPTPYPAPPLDEKNKSPPETFLSPEPKSTSDENPTRRKRVRRSRADIAAWRANVSVDDPDSSPEPVQATADPDQLPDLENMNSANPQVLPSAEKVIRSARKSTRRRSTQDNADPSLGPAEKSPYSRSKSSLNNPKLLETVEDAIRRLILPELVVLEREQATRTARHKSRKSQTDKTPSNGLSDTVMAEVGSANDEEPDTIDSRDDTDSIKKAATGEGDLKPNDYNDRVPDTPEEIKRTDHGAIDSLSVPRASHNSQKSLLIEYFEEAKRSGSVGTRPSIRVRLAPSARKWMGDKVEIKEGSRKPSYTRQIVLPSQARGEIEDKQKPSVRDTLRGGESPTSLRNDF